jgi:hypothetical protein
VNEFDSEPVLPNPDDADLRDAEVRRRVRRFAFGLVLLVVVLGLLTVGYVLLYGRLLRDPDAPPSVRSLNPKVLAFEVALWVTVVLAVGFGLNRYLRRRR